jgi:hypothetical protein
MAQASFARVLLLSDKPPPAGSDPTIEWQQIGPLHSRADYSRFMVRELADYISTPHALCVQWDGFVLNGVAWDPRFLEYDYIGAPWPHFRDGFNVGNGGFSLRSRLLMVSCRHLPVSANVSEDVLICRLHRAELEQAGIRFAPEAVAARFSFERTKRTGEEFGFHGCFNLIRLMAPDSALSLLQSLEPQVLSRGERRELLWWALNKGQLKIAMLLLARLFT